MVLAEGFGIDFLKTSSRGQTCWLQRGHVNRRKQIHQDAQGVDMLSRIVA